MFRPLTRFKRDGDLAHTTPRQCCRSWNCRAPKIEIRRAGSNRTSHLMRSECSTLPCRLARSACSRSMSSIGETEYRVKTCPCAHALRQTHHPCKLTLDKSAPPTVIQLTDAMGLAG